MMNLDEIGIETSPPVTCTFCKKKGRPCTTQDVHDIKIAKRWLEYSPAADAGRRHSEQSQGRSSDQEVLPPRARSICATLQAEPPRPQLGASHAQPPQARNLAAEAIAAHVAAITSWLGGWLLLDFEATSLLQALRSESCDQAWQRWCSAWRRWGLPNERAPPKLWQAAAVLDAALASGDPTQEANQTATLEVVRKTVLAHGVQYLRQPVDSSDFKIRCWRDAAEALLKQNLPSSLSLALAFITFSATPPPFVAQQFPQGRRTRATQVIEEMAVMTLQAQHDALVAGTTGVKMLLEVLQVARSAFGGPNVLGDPINHLATFAFTIDGVFLSLRGAHPIFDISGSGSLTKQDLALINATEGQANTTAPRDADLLPYIRCAVALNANLQHNIAATRLEQQSSRYHDQAVVESRRYRDRLHQMLLLGLQELSSLSPATQQSLLFAMLDVCFSVLTLASNSAATFSPPSEALELKRLATLSLFAVFDAPLPGFSVILHHPVPAFVVEAVNLCCSSAYDLLGKADPDAPRKPQEVCLLQIQPCIARIFGLLDDLRSAMPFVFNERVDHTRALLESQFESKTTTAVSA